MALGYRPDEKRGAMASVMTEQAESPFFRRTLFYPLCGLLALSAIALRWWGLPFMTHDMQDFLLPWFDYIVTHGRFAALSDAFYNYTPFYIYLMTAASYLDGFVDRVILIKSISFLFDIIAALVVYKIGIATTGDRRRSAFFALLFLNLPTVILNGAFWGQCDIIFMTFLLSFAYCLIRRRPILAMLMYGIALSIKVQAIFLAPLRRLPCAQRRHSLGRCRAAAAGLWAAGAAGGDGRARLDRSFDCVCRSSRHCPQAVGARPRISTSSSSIFCRSSSFRRRPLPAWLLPHWSA